MEEKKKSNKSLYESRYYSDKKDELDDKPDESGQWDKAENEKIPAGMKKIYVNIFPRLNRNKDSNYDSAA